jgi:putative chitinase
MRMIIVAVAAVAMSAAAGAEELAQPGASTALSAGQLRAIMPKLDAGRADTFLKPLGGAMKEFGITTPKRQAAFLAQVAHECGQLRFQEEMMASQSHENRAELGNTSPGDGAKYKGRGPLMLTGRANYKAAGQALKLDLEAKPELVSQPDIGCRVAGWYWKTQGLNELADRGDFRGITQHIHGDLVGLDARMKFYRQAKQVLGVRD